MPISFLNPTLLLGALASALPVIIHFLSRRRVQRRSFSDLRFLDEVQARQARSLGVRRWLLLLLRVLALLAVAVAAAGPRWGGLDAGSGARSVLFVVDASASMNTGRPEGGTRLDEAVRVCGGMIRSLPDGTAVQVLLAGARTRPLFGDWLPAGTDAAAGLELVAPTDGAFDPTAVFDEAARLVARAPGSPVQIVLVGDLQDDGADPAAWREAARRLREAGEVHVLLRGVGEAVPGGAVLDVALPGRAVRPGENVTLRARVRPAFPDQVFVLDLDGRPVGEAVASPAADGSAVGIDFPLTVPGVGRHAGAVRKETDALPADDVRPFVLEVPTALDVLVAHGADGPRDGAGGRGGRRYLAEALRPGGAPSLFRTRVMPAASLTTGDITASDVVVFVDPDPLGRRVQEGLAAWLEDGGQAVFVLGDPRLTAWLEGTLLPALGLPAGTAFAAAGEPGQRARILAPRHPVFRGLEPAALTTFGEIPWHRWFRLGEGPDTRVLLELTGEDPLLLEQPVGAGRAVLLAADLQPASGGLAGSPMALPFLQRLVAWLAGDAPTAGPAVAGGEVVLRPRDERTIARLERADGLRVLGPDGQETATPAVAWRRGAPLLTAGVADRAGLYTFLAGADTLGVVAVAVPAAESAPDLLEPAAYGRRLAAVGLAPSADLSGRAPSELTAVLGGRDLAPWLLMAALALLTAELGLGRGARP